MSFLGWIASSGWLALWVPAGLVFLGLGIWQFAVWTEERREWGRWITIGIMLVLVILCCLASDFSLTHRVVPLNTKAVIVDKTTGSIIGNMRPSGLTEFPAVGVDYIEFRAGTKEQVCIDFTPSVKGGYEVKLTTCFFVNLANVDWTQQIRSYNRYTFEEIIQTWQNQLAPKVAVAVKGFLPQELTEKRDQVSMAIYTSTLAWFDSEFGSTADKQSLLLSVSLANWDFTNEDVGKEFDKTIIAQTQQAQANARYDAAVVNRKTDLYEAQTQVSVTLALADGQVQAMKMLGIAGEDAVIRYLTIQWLRNLPTAPDNVIVNTSGEAIMPAVPTAP